MKLSLIYLAALIFVSGCVALDTFYIKRNIDVDLEFSRRSFNVNVTIENTYPKPITVNTIDLLFDTTQFTCRPPSSSFDLVILSNEKKIFRFEDCQVLQSALPGEFLIRGNVTYTTDRTRNSLEISGRKIIVNIDRTLSTN